MPYQYDNAEVVTFSLSFLLSQFMLLSCHFSPLAEIPGSIELMENPLTYEGVQWRKIVQCSPFFSRTESHFGMSPT